MKNQGFTLIEVLLVVVLLSVIVTLSAPRFKGTFKNLQLKKTADDIAYLMKYAQSRSITKNNPVRFEFDSAFNTYYLLENTNGEFTTFPSRMAKKSIVPSTLNIISQEHQIDFYPDGSIDRQSIEVCNADDCYVVSTEHQRGYVHVYKEE